VTTATGGRSRGKEKDVRTRIALTAVAALALASVPAVAVAGKGGNGNGKGPSGKEAGGGGNVQLTSFAISGQGPGWVMFSLSTANPTSASLGVNSICYDDMSQPIWQQDLAVSWDADTAGHAGAFSPPSGKRCYAYVHSAGSSDALDGGTFSYLAP
jgi:hypothetical protein